MKKLFIVCMTGAMMLSSCTSYDQMNGVFTGSMLGGIFGSSIGGLMDGPRGHDAGNLMGMVIGGAVGAAATAPRTSSRSVSRYDDYDVYGGYSKSSKSYSSTINEADASNMAKEFENLSIENLRFVDFNNNQTIDANEQAKIIFELKNNGSNTLYNITPVIGVTDNKHILISPTAIISSLEPGKTVRYTAEVRGKNNLKTGQADFSIGFAKGDLVYNMTTFQLATRSK